ncbi:SOS response-associated peptidase [Georgenia sp. TF02-10]|uniref:SOS response-associated peptidase n=1 Tax=Georgenia sp. TF02-10 TaxID=2917725 RepID=UPI001FA729F6|nr:SOS response-associated peptidase [Georgenia sp. TF02-10]UNX55222.1 SOS response-associated peptidase [Georgenia sp. TF02-10]
MCGRYAASRRDADLVSAFAVEDVVGEELPPSWNVAPTDAVRVVLERGSETAPPRRQLRTTRWGLVPSWAKDPSGAARLINARSETVTEKPAFKAAAARRRCLVPADGYYEWQKLPGGRKQPYFLHADDTPLTMAGLYELWPDPALDPDDPHRWRWTCTVLTTRATDALGHVHDRSPLLVPADLQDDWLDPGLTDPAQIRSLVAAMPEPVLTPRPVGAAVGNVNNDGPGLVEPVTPAEA